MIFTNAYILGVQRKGDFFSDNVGRYRSVDTISIEGYIDSRASNDRKGVRQTLVAIQNYVSAANSSASSLEEITINGSGFGSGKIVSIDFPASEEFDENQITIGKYTAEIETYNGGEVSTILETNLPDENFIESFSEDFSISLDEENVYNFEHSVDITYMSGDGIDPVSLSKQAANTLFTQVPTQFSTLIADSYGGINSTARRYYTETYDLANGACSFNQKFKLFPTEASSYSLKVTTSLEMNEQGIMTVTENGEITPRSTTVDIYGNDSYLETVKNAAATEINTNAYTRCNAEYNTYKSYLGINAGTLHTIPLTISKNIDSSSATLSYNINFTDQDSVETLSGGQYVTRTITVDRKNDNITTVAEEGEITFRGANSQNPSILIDDPTFGSDFYNRIPSRSTAKARCLEAYEQAYSPHTGELHNISNKFSIKAYKNSFTYNYVFNDDFKINDDGLFSQFSIQNDDKIGVVNQSQIKIPNQPSELVHTPGQTSLGSRSTKAEAILRRNKYYNTLSDIKETAALVESATNTAKPAVQGECLMFRADNPAVFSYDTSQQYISNASYSFNSDYTYSMSMDVTYVMLRGKLQQEYNLALPGTAGREPTP